MIQITVVATGFEGERYKGVKPAGEKKLKDSDFICFDEFAKMRERSKRPDYLNNYLPPKDYQDDLDVPSVIRNYSAPAEERESVRLEMN
jgi:hypothetical protein